MKKVRLSISFLLAVFAIAPAFCQTPADIAAHKRKWDTPAWTDTITNPLAHVPAAADSGRVLYMKVCSVCHGTGGKGDGVASAGLTIKPANHTSAMVQMQTDGSLFYELSNGHAPMPAYKTTLTEKQRWQLICFIRTLKPKPAKK
jgi:mono/diheme cytochrome c family protein